MANYNGQTTGTQEGDVKAGYMVNGAYLTNGQAIVAPGGAPDTSGTSGASGSGAVVPPPANPTNPSPQNPQAPALSKVGTGSVGPDGKPIYDVFSGTEHVSDPNDPRLKGVNITQLPGGTAPTGFQSKFEKGFNQANANGVQTPTSDGSGASTVNQFAPNGTNYQADTVIAANKAHQQYLDDYAAYQTSLKQNETLTQEYSRLTKEAGIPALNTQLLNMKNIMDGSEEDIRTEITKAGGFATNSQVLALTTARNKSMIQNYNNLLQTRNDLQANLTTMMGLSEQDRAYASQQIDKQLNFDTQQETYADKMLTNAQDSLNNSAKTMGWAGILKSALATGDPQAVARINSTMGNGFDLSQAAQKETEAKAKEEAANQLDLKLKNAQIAKIYSDINKADTQVVDVGGKKYLINSQTGKTIKEIAPTGSAPEAQKQIAESQGQIQQIGGLLKTPSLGAAVGTTGLSRIQWNPFGSGKGDFVAGVEQLRSQLNLQSLIDAKSKGATFGALSDQEGQMLANAATKIGTWAIKDKDGKVTGYKTSEKSFKAELDKINNFAKLDYILKGGNPADVDVQTMPDGSHWVKNSDGTTTQL